VFYDEPSCWSFSVRASRQLSPKHGGFSAQPASGNRPNQPHDAYALRDLRGDRVSHTHGRP
jgi:hypothetical protein